MRRPGSKREKARGLFPGEGFRLLPMITRRESIQQSDGEGTVDAGAGNLDGVDAVLQLRNLHRGGGLVDHGLRHNLSGEVADFDAQVALAFEVAEPQRAGGGAEG